MWKIRNFSFQSVLELMATRTIDEVHTNWTVLLLTLNIKILFYTPLHPFHYWPLPFILTIHCSYIREIYWASHLQNYAHYILLLNCRWHTTGRLSWPRLPGPIPRSIWPQRRLQPTVPPTAGIPAVETRAHVPAVPTSVWTARTTWWRQVSNPLKSTGN